MTTSATEFDATWAMSPGVVAVDDVELRRADWIVASSETSGAAKRS